VIKVYEARVDVLTNVEELLKKIPQVDKLMQSEVFSGCEFYHNEITEAVRETLADLREKIKNGCTDTIPNDSELANSALLKAKNKASDKDIKRVINATGVILHSNLGRASLSESAIKAIVESASSYCSLEYDIGRGNRGNRTGGVEKYLKDITGCEASLVVNNNAAAVLLILTSLASGGNVIVSRGELVEIGGGFRVPDIMSQCGCSLHEVGTTNKTRIDDYESAVTTETKALLKVHTSNFKVIGFTESVDIKELSKLGKKHNIPVIEDIGSGALTDVKRYGLHDEPIVKESLKNGADIVSFSGDKLLGSLQCGIIAGSEKYISVMKKHPLYRAFRVDKITIAALEATLRIYRDTSATERDIPVISMLSVSDDVLKARAESLCDEILKRGGYADVIKTKSTAGGGSVPGLELPSYAVSPAGSQSADEAEKILRLQSIPIIGRIENDRLLLDVRTIFNSDHEYMINAITEMTKLSESKS